MNRQRKQFPQKSRVTEAQLTTVVFIGVVLAVRIGVTPPLLRNTIASLAEEGAVLGMAQLGRAVHLILMCCQEPNN